mgnify:FL=1
MEGTIFDIQRFSVHDGPGIRTTVFMKGCPLRCRWCHNPEGLAAAPQLQYTEQECIHCGLCGGHPTLENVKNCPSGALKICGRKISAEKLLEETLRDKAFYGTEGGVTFSGGECMMQADFVAEMLRLIKARGLTTAIDTSGYTSWDSFEKTLDFCDWYLYDMKMYDAALHKKYTGVDNKLILENLKRLSGTGRKIWIRVPVIPDVNDTVEELTAIADFVAPLPNIEQLRLIPYHTLGKSKYETLFLECGYSTDKSITQEQLREYAQIFLDRNIAVKE